MDQHKTQWGFATVRFDNWRAGYRASRHLRDHGHQQICMIAGPISAPISEERILGYSQAWAEAEGQWMEAHGDPFTFVEATR